MPIRHAALAALWATAAFGAPARATPVTCTNPSSGAVWTLALDDAAATVDGIAAQITAKVITWRDPSDNRRYALDRASGALTVIIPSSTGGYILHDQCQLPRPHRQ